MKRFNSTIRALALLLTLVLYAPWNTGFSQCQIKSSSNEGCVGGINTFEAIGPSANGADSVIWFDGTTTYRTNLAAMTFGSPGTRTIELKVYKNGVLCTQTMSFEVNPNPKANFVLKPNFDFKQCFSGNEFCFENKSIPAGSNSIDTFTYIFGGPSSGDANPCFSSGNPLGGPIDVELRIIDEKGCTDDEIKTAYIEIVPDMDLQFSTGAAASCGSTTVPISNNSAIPFSDITSFHWDFGDGTSYASSNGTNLGQDSCYWFNPVHVYTKHGCFDVRLIVTNSFGCTDTLLKKGFACNVNPLLEIEESNGKESQCFNGNSFLFTHSIDPLNWPIWFNWNFGDPDSGNQNNDNQNFKDAPHVFTKPDIFTVTITGAIHGCGFTSTKDVLVKGPGARIDDRKLPDVVPWNLRHQCQIQDTVLFTNNSTYFMNDSYPHDDVLNGASTSIYKGSIAYLMEIPSPNNLEQLENVIDEYHWNGEVYYAVGAPLMNPNQTTALIVDTLIKYNNFFGGISGQRQGNHVRTVWDFGDNTAPQCTTWTSHQQNIWDYSKPVYQLYNPDSNHYKTIKASELASAVFDANTGLYYFDGNGSNGYELQDTTYEWMNCNYSRDILPKHWYTPGTEQCFTVQLTLEDTTFAQAVDGYTYDYFTYDGNGNIVADSGGVFDKDILRFTRRYMLDSIHSYPALLDQNGDTVWNYSQFCASEKLGYKEDQSLPPLFNGYDTLWAKEWINPNVQNGSICKSTNSIPLALTPPKAEGLRFTGVPCYGPVPPYGVYFDWSNAQPGCTQQMVWFHYDSLADRRDNAPLVMNQWQPQNALNLSPVASWPAGTLGQPTWPTRIFKQYQPGQIADSCGWLTVGLRIQNGVNPTTNQPCIDEAWFHKFLRYTPNDSRFMIDKNAGCNPLEVNVTLATPYHDSLVSMNFAYRNTDPNKIDDFFMEVDSIFRRKTDPVSGKLVNYILTYHVYADGSSKKVDSLTYVPGVGGVQACGSEIKLKQTRKFVFPHQGRYAITVTATNTDGCVSPRTDFVTIGFYKDVFLSKSVICRNETVEMVDTALYFRRFPDPVTGDFLFRHSYWQKPEQTMHPNGDPRTWPFAQREKVYWDFDQGQGYVQFSGTPTPKPKVVAYPLPGHYQIRVAFVDSLGCSDTVQVPLDVTGVLANFESNLGVDPNACKPIVTFYDSSRVFDPCRISKGQVCDSIIRWTWYFGDGKMLVTGYNQNAAPVRNPSHLYRNFGDYDVVLVVETELGCIDTLRRTISIEGPRPKMEIAIDSVGCVPFTVYLRNTSIDPSPAAIWKYDFGDSFSMTTNSDSTVYHTYTKPGEYELSLIQFDGVPLLPGATCQDSFPDFPRKIKVRVLPKRKASFHADRIRVCPNELITFTDSSDSIYDNFTWIFGDGDTLVLSEADGGRQVTHRYVNEGNYTVRLRPNYIPQNGEPKCNQSHVIRISVKGVHADFVVDSSDKPVFRFTNKSVNGTKYWWNYGQGNGFEPCELVNPTDCPNGRKDYGDQTGDFRITLVTLSPEGCYDTAYRWIKNDYEVIFNVPNVFTPNGDGVNDDFQVEIDGWLKYEIQVFNRHGAKVFESEDPLTSWNGQKMNTGNELSPGVYYVVIKYQLRGQPEKEYQGTVTLIRN